MELLQVGQPSTVTQTPQEADIGEDKDAAIFTTGIHIPRQEVTDDEIKHLSRTVCG